MWSALRIWWHRRRLGRRDLRAQLAAVRELQRFSGVRADEALASALQSPFAEVCQQALGALAERRSTTVLPDVVALFDHPSADVVFQALTTANKLDPQWQTGSHCPNRETTLLDILRLARRQNRPDLWRAAERALCSAPVASCGDLLRIAWDESEDAGIREVALLTIAESGTADNATLHGLLELCHTSGAVPWLVAGALRCLAEHEHPEAGRLLRTLLERWDGSDSGNYLAEAAFQVVSQTGCHDVADTALATLTKILRRHRSSANTRALSVAAFKTCGELLGHQGPHPLLDMVRDQATFAFSNPYLGHFALRYDWGILGTGTALALNVERAHRQWSKELRQISVASLTRKLQDSTCTGNGGTDDAFANPLRQIAIADGTKIKLTDAGIDPCDVLLAFDQQAPGPRRTRFHNSLDARTLARLWNVGRYWRSVSMCSQELATQLVPAVSGGGRGFRVSG